MRAATSAEVLRSGDNIVGARVEQLRVKTSGGSGVHHEQRYTDAQLSARPHLAHRAITVPGHRDAHARLGREGRGPPGESKTRTRKCLRSRAKHLAQSSLGSPISSTKGRSDISKGVPGYLSQNLATAPT